MADKPQWQLDRAEAVKLIDEALRLANAQEPPNLPEDPIALLHAALNLGDSKAKAAKEKERALAKERELQEKAEKKAAEEREKAEKKAAAERERLERKTMEEREKKSREEARQAEKKAVADAAKRSAEEKREAEEMIKQEKAQAKAAAEAERKAMEEERKRLALDKKAAAAAEAERAKAERDAAANAKAMAEAAEAAKAAAASKAANQAAAAPGTETPRTKSGASAISEKRLERASTRFSSLGWRRGSEDAGSDDGPSYSLMNVKGNAASKAISDAKAVDAKAAAGELRAGDGDVSDAAAPTLNELSNYLKAINDAKGGGGGGGRRKSSSDSDCLALLDDGDTLVCIGGDGDGSSVSTYSASKGKTLRHLHGHGGLVCCVAADVRGDLIASAGRDKTIRLWAARSGECIATLEGCEDQVHGLSLRSPLLVSGEGSKQRGNVRCWSVDEQRQLAAFSEHSGPIWSVSMSDSVALSGSFDATARIWPLEGLLGGAGDEGATRKVRSLAKLEHPTSVQSCSIDGNLAATGCGDRIVRLWSLATHACLRSLTHGIGWSQHPIFSVRLSRGVLLSAGEDKAIRVWSLAAEDEAEPCVATLQHGATVRGLALSANGFLASAGGNQKKLLVWRPTTS